MKPTPYPIINDWLAAIDQRGKSQATQDTYRRGMLHFIRWSEQTYGDAFDPTQIIPRDIEEWIAYQQTVEKAKVNTINSRITGVSRFFAWAVKNQVIPNNPTDDTSTIRTTRRRPKALKKNYVRKLLRQIHQGHNLRDAAMVECLLGAGLRVSELLALQKSDITLGERSGQVEIRRGKGAVHRIVPLTAPVRKALQTYLNDDKLRKAYEDDHTDLDDSTPLWIGERGPLTDRSGVFYLLKKYARRAGLDSDLISSHVLRHTFSTRYLEANPDDLRGLASLLGHASLNTVMIYTEPTSEMLAERMARAEIPAERI
ncbi:MAG: tyrosine-type recombinase/integrase [Chloroflexota bacterium]